MWRSILIVSLMIYGLPSYGQSNDEDSSFRRLLANCNSEQLGQLQPPSPALQVGLCFGYVAGVMDMAGYLRGAQLCLPPGVTIRDVVKMVRKYGSDHPERLYRERGPEVLRAIGAAFPCKEK